MLVGKKIGPFVVDKELGSGAMGAVYRAKHEATGMFVAIKMVSPALGSNPQSMKRFEREAAILKQLKHENIVRLVATGKYQKMPFYAMEYVEGESLDHVMERRGRITWEELVPLGQQLCAALQHAHAAGIVHRDLKPANVMILPDGTVKLTDFGIAKDLDVTGLTAANSTVGTAAYMSPEQCKGAKDISSRSDLYSMGVMFYELVTGRKPFIAESAIDMFVKHSEGLFERPSRIVMDIPIWLDTLICQLMEKSPDKRPFDAETVSRSLGQIKEKVEAQRSAGLERVKSRRSGRSGTAPELDEKDREAARTLLRKRKRKKKVPVHQQTWFRATFFGFILVVIMILFYFAFIKKPEPDQLYRRAERLIQSTDYDDHQRARKGPIADFLYYYPDDKRAKKMRDWKDFANSELFERQMHRRRSGNLNLSPRHDAEKMAWQALTYEEEGNWSEAEKLWQKVIAYHKKEDDDKRPWGYIGKRYQSRLSAAEEHLANLIKLAKKEKPKVDDDLDEKALAAIRQEEDIENIDSAILSWTELRNVVEDDEDKHKWLMIARHRIRELKIKKAQMQNGK